MNKKKRYSNPLEVRLEILRLRKQAGKDIEKAEALEAEIEEHRQSGQNVTSLQFILADWRKSASRLRKHHSYLLEKKIPMLSRVLAKLKTQPMAFMKDSSEMEESIK